jgi:ubiquinone/menaquinone biosynthesis C-methylase UbiE
MTDRWRVWDETPSYGETLYKRATGELPEMESSKSVAKIIKRICQPGDKILDVGCGAGHYLKSFRREIGGDIPYKGIDATKQYLELAQQAFKSDKNAQFMLGDIFNLDIDDSSFEIVTCNNLLLHLPSIQKPLSELIRVSKRDLVIRFLCGDRTFQVKDVFPNDQEDEIDDNGEPKKFGFFNIYRDKYIERLLSKNGKVKKWKVSPDLDFDPQKVMKSKEENSGAYNSTQMIGKYQFNGYLMLPWSILEIEVK